MRFVKFEPAHMAALEIQPAQARFIEWMTPEIAKAAAAHFAFTGMDARGVVGCAGLAPIEDGSLVAWAMFSERIAGHKIALVRAVRQGLDLHRTVPVVAHVHEGHAKAAAFAEALSFKFLEARTDLHPSGAVLHVYVREGAYG